VSRQLRTCALRRVFARFSHRLYGGLPVASVFVCDHSPMPSRGQSQSSRSPEQWIEITLRVPPAQSELIAGVLQELAPDGVSIEPAIRTSDMRDFAYEYLDAPTLLRACVRAPFHEAQRRALRRRLDALGLQSPPGRIRYSALRTTDWSEEWKRFFHVLRVGRLVVRPSWEEFDAGPDDLVIDLDPGAAFGTGQHETTRLCLAALEAHLRPRMRVIDVGTGSGILAIAAARLGAASVLALDIDASAIDVARESIARNAVDEVVSLMVGSLSDDPDSATAADLILANISSQTVLALLPAISETLAPDGRAILSGFIEEAAAGIEAAARATGLHTLATSADGEWRCLVVRRSGR
jgi:ribosomal protein L11 methyltransferase